MKSVPCALAALCGAAVATSAASSCCQHLEAALAEKVSFPDTVPYNTTEASYFSIQESELKPACILHPISSKDVAKAVSILSRDAQCKFAIKSGGHGPSGGFANIQDGVTFDLTSMAGVQVSDDQSVAQVGAGATWLSVYQALEPQGLAVAGGRNGNVGVGGLLLGGGISHFTTRVGWACDNVVNYEVVLPNGQIVQANRHSHTDLYHALQGGGNNFGIVTRFDLAAFPQSNISVTAISNDISYREQVFDAFTGIVNSSPFDPDASLVMALLYSSTTKAWSLTNSAVYTKPVTSPAIFQNLSSVPNISSKTSITSLAEFANEKKTPPLNWWFSTATFKADAAFMLEMFDILNATIYDVNPPGGVTWSVAIEPLVGKMLTTGETLGMKHTDKGYVILISPLWPDVSSRELVDQTAKDALARVEEAARDKGLLQQFRYTNYAAPYQRPIESYGRDQVRRLRETSRKYDKHSVLQRQVPGGHKIY